MQFPRGEISSNIYRVKKNSARLSEWKKKYEDFYANESLIKGRIWKLNFFLILILVQNNKNFVVHNMNIK